MLEKLRAFIEAESAKDTVWGVSDCCTLGGDWAASLGYPDPVADWRGRYSCEAEALQLLQEDGGLVAAVSRGLKSIGWTECEPQIGTIAVLDLPGCALAWDEAVAICGDRFWACRSERGITYLPRADTRVVVCFGEPG